MGIEALAGTIMIAGFGLWTAAMIIAPPNLYREADLHARADIVERHIGRWYTSQACFGLGMLAVGGGFLPLSLADLVSAAPWLANAGTGSLLAAGAIGAVGVYRQTIDPVGFWSGPKSPVEVSAGIALLILTMAGLVLWGIALAQTGLPVWIGSLMAVAGGLFASIYMLTRGRGGFFLISLAYLVAFVVGIALVRSG